MLFSLGRQARIGAATLRALLGLLNDGVEELDPPASETILGPRLDEVVQEVTQLHDMAVGIQDCPAA